MNTRWNPFHRTPAELIPFGSALALTTEFDNLFRDLAKGGFSQLVSLNPAADIVETENTIQVKVDLPGHSAKDIQVKLEGDTLTIQSERKQEKEEKGENQLRTERSYGLFSRSFVLPSSVDGSKPEARYLNGVLMVTLPKAEAAKARVIEVKE
ncbi:MAG TPA: Hsp20/alpha crystallin family protein [Myxococcaceae bacterium]|jgi:HSP20 family protein|nr:Hsp20/alpha crystallin family protein [Myxococcaceae bacterium]